MCRIHGTIDAKGPSPGTPMETPPPSPFTRYNKVNRDGSGRFDGAPSRRSGRATPSQAVIEIALFSVFALLVVLAGVALYFAYSPKHKIVPNYVDDGLKHDRVNILLIGIGGENHPKRDQLADTIMLLSLKPSTGQVAVISVPRDLWVRIGRYGTHRLNYAHAIGNQSGYPGEGPGLLCDTVAQVFNQRVDAFVRIDFSAFEKVIDDAGGIDVYCQRSFYDYLFKDGFTRGWHHLNGKRALAYARYRYVLGPEGDNFARELRQQQVINALREKLHNISPQQAVNLVQALSTISDATETNLTKGQMVTLYRRFHGTDPRNIRHVSLKPLTEVFAVRRLSDAGEAVRPRGGDYRPFQTLARDIFSSEQQISTEDQIQFAAGPSRSQTMLPSVD
jgi:LCP family protein required for cell wall assembly